MEPANETMRCNYFPETIRYFYDMINLPEPRVAAYFWYSVACIPKWGQLVCRVVKYDDHRLTCNVHYVNLEPHYYTNDVDKRAIAFPITLALAAP